MKHKKDNFWKDLWGTLLGKFPYIVLGWFVYPFLNRTKIREKIYSGNYSRDTFDLWLMMNDDELQRYDVDYDVAKEGRATTWLGHLWKSYSFNALRNPAYNYSLFYNPVVTSYDVKEIEWNTLVKDEKSVSALTWAKWVWETGDGRLDNEGIRIHKEASTLGKSKVWYDPHNGEDIWYCRWSRALRYKYLLWDVYHTFRIGAFGHRYDIVVKYQHQLKFSVRRKLVPVRAWFRRVLLKFS